VKEKKKPQKGVKNVKAVAVENLGRLSKKAGRTSDIQEKVMTSFALKVSYQISLLGSLLSSLYNTQMLILRTWQRLHVPFVEHLPEEVFSIIVAVVGPPGVGKTALIKDLIKRYTKRNLSSPTGPLTVVTSKKRRLTLLS
jgi:Cdc6-like AAA superfamily ATPase